MPASGLRSPETLTLEPHTAKAPETLKPYTLHRTNSADKIQNPKPHNNAPSKLRKFEITLDPRKT